MFLYAALGIFFALIALCFVLLAKALKADRADYDRARGDVTPNAFPPPPTTKYVYQNGSPAAVKVEVEYVGVDDEPLLDALTVIAEVAMIDALADQPIYDPPTYDAPTYDPPLFDGGNSGGGGGGSDW